MSATESPSVIEPGKVRAPDFPEGLDWLNVERPLTMADLRGKIVLLDFWTYCCINCLHVLKELERLEEKYRDELVVIGVHSAKFDAEKQTDRIRQAVLRYGIEHPVVNDAEMRLWSEYAVRAWPSFMLIDPLGKVFGTHSGEQVYELFDKVIGEMAAHYEQRGELRRGPLELDLERRRAPQSLLSFPGKVLADEAGDRLFIADSGHNRIVVASLTTGNVLDVLGSGEGRLADGDFAEAAFFNPQGMAVEGDLLYIADTDNHAIRRADLRSRTVVTLAGTSRQDFEFDNTPGPARGRALNSPWDVTIAHGVLFIAMAGSHQIWGLDLDEHYIAGHAGSGQEDHVDGPLLGAALAQPSGLTHDGNYLFVADSEVSSIRAVDLDPRGGHVKTVVGEGLFDFGDVDGGPAEARLQHPLDVEYVEGTLFVADTYNNKIKTIGLHTRNAKAFAGSGEADWADGEAGEACFHEPGGLSSGLGRLYVADTNNHVIRVVDVASGRTSTFEIRDPQKLARRTRGEVELEPMRTGPGPLRLRIELALPEGAKLNPDAPSQIEVVQDGDLQAFPAEGGAVEATVVAGRGDVLLDTSIYYCREEGEKLCLYDMKTYRVPLVPASDGPSEATVSLAIGS